MYQIFNNFIATLRRYKVSSTLNILGLGVAFASLYIIVVQVKYDLTFNHSIKGGENIYLAVTPEWGSDDKKMTSLPRYFMEEAAICSPIIEEVAAIPRYTHSDRVFFAGQNGNSGSAVIKSAYDISANAFTLLDYNIIEGSLDNFNAPNRSQNGVISSNLAKKYNIKVGDLFYLNDDDEESDKPTTIVAIFEDRAPNSSYSSVDLFLNIPTYQEPEFNQWNNSYIVKSSATADELNDRVLNEIAIQLKNLYPNVDIEGDYSLPNVTFVPLKKIYFDSTIIKHQLGYKDKMYTILLLIIAILILVVATVNFINFFFALIPIRIRTINIYKIFGGDNFSLKINFITDTIFMVLIALAAAAIMVLVIDKLSIINFMTAPIDFKYNISTAIIVVTGAIALAIVISIYPSYFMTKFSPAFTLKGNFGFSKHGKRLRYILVSSQFIIAFCMIMSVTMLTRQFNFMYRSDLGFNSENLLLIEVDYNAEIIKDSCYEIFTNKLKQDADIISTTSLMGYFFGTVHSRSGTRINDKHYLLDVNYVARNFLEFMEIDIVEGDNFLPGDRSISDDGSTYIFNQSAQSLYEIDMDRENKTRHNLTIRGIIKDVNYKLLRSEISPMAYCLTEESHARTTTVVRYKEGADIARLSDRIRNIIAEIEGQNESEDTKIMTFEEHQKYVYESELKLIGLIGLFTIVSILISLMGVIGLVYFEAQYRIKEIAVRRVYGATVREILEMMNKKFITLSAICFVVAAPISYLIIERWLLGFAYRIKIDIVSYLVIFVATTLVVVITVTLCSLRAANSNPAGLIRNS